MRNKSIRYYFFTSITTVLVASVLAMGMIQTYLAVGYFKVEKLRILQEVAQVISDAAAFGQMSEENDFLSVKYMAQVAGASVFIAAQDGTVTRSIGENAPRLGQKVSPEVLAAIEENGKFDDAGTLGGVFGGNFYTSALPLKDINGKAMGFVFASSSSIAMRVYLLDTISTYVLSAGVVLLVSSLLAFGLSNRMLIPILRVSSAARRFGEGDFNARVPIEGNDELTHLAITFNNMADSLKATDVSRRSFMGNIAHELRTPMTTIKGFIDGMLDDTIPNKEQQKYLVIVSDEVGRLARLTKNMLDISRLEAGEYTPNIVSFDLCKTLTQVFLAAEKRLEDKGISLTGLDECPHCMVQADQDFVHQVLFNLADNAIKFAGEGGTVSVSIKESKGFVTTGIKNTGSGIQAETLPFVFDRFYKADKSRGINARGAGLGLHISKVLVGLMGGRVWAESEEGAWSEFLFTLPAAPPAKKAPKGKKGVSN